MRIALIYLPQPFLARPFAYAPLGLLYIASSLENAGNEVRIFNFSQHNELYAADQLESADIFGITATSLELPLANRLAKSIKERFPGAVVVLGGPGTVTDEYVDFSSIDLICKGEGESTILEILHDITKRQVKRIYQGKPPEDLNSLPFPARHLLSDNKGQAIFSFNMDVEGQTESTIISGSRGCPFSCAFCTSPMSTYHRGKLRLRSPQSIAEEVRQVIRQFGIRQFKFCDELFTLEKNRIHQICKLLAPLDIAWKASARTKPFDYEMAQMMKEGGCKEIAFGVESFDNDVLKILNKGTTAEDNARALEATQSAGLASRVLFMIGTPGQSSKTVPTNIHWIKNVPFDFIACTDFVPIPGSDCWNNPSRYGIEIIDYNLENYNFYHYRDSHKSEQMPSNVFRFMDRPPAEVENECETFRDFLEATGKVNKG